MVSRKPIPDDIDSVERLPAEKIHSEAGPFGLVSWPRAPRWIMTYGVL